MKKCPKCGKEVLDNINVCTACGAKITESKVKVEKKEAAPAYGVITGVLAIAGIYLIANVWSLLGALVYFVGFGMALSEIKKDKDFSDKNFGDFAKKSLKKQNILKKGIPAIVVVIMPLVVAYGIYGWIILDSIRTAQHITDLIM